MTKREHDLLQALLAVVNEDMSDDDQGIFEPLVTHNRMRRMADIARAAIAKAMEES